MEKAFKAKLQSDGSIEVICTACWMGPCVIAYLAKQEAKDTFTITEDAVKNLTTLECEHFIPEQK